MCSQPMSSDTGPGRHRLNRKALALLSGGLDSALAIHLVKRQGVDVTAVSFTSFFSPLDTDRPDSTVRVLAEQLDVPLILRPKGRDFLDIIRNPAHGHGKNLNPCIDCRIYTFRKAKELAQEIAASFIVTGEVLGQRPMSQRRDAMALIDRESGCRGLVLRPLSALLLPPTFPEEAGVIDRGQLLDVAGRGRKVQLRIAKEIGLTGYSSPAGGCLLTDKGFSSRLRDLLEAVEEPTPEDLELLRVGRHFRLRPGLKIVVGRNQEENRSLEELAGPNTIFSPREFPGPTIVCVGSPEPDEYCLIGSVVRRYSKESSRGDRISVRGPDAGERLITVSEIAAEDWLSERVL